MQSELRGAVPKLPFAFTKTLVNRAWKTVREANLWSFNLFESAWITPPPINSGTATVVQGQSTVSFDLAVATPALLAGNTNYSLISQRQFRAGNVAGVSGIYNIVAMNFATGVATLDRIFADPSLTAGQYTVYQCYYTPPMLDFLTWLSVRNMQMFLNLGLDMNRAQVDARDPQRSWYQFPTEVTLYSTDNRAGSSTAGYPMFELWGQAVTPFTYQCYGVRRGVDLVNPTDTLPIEVGEDVVLAKAREYAYEWCEANKDMSPRSSGPDFRFLMGKTNAEYVKRLIEYRKNDKEKVDNWFSSRSILWSGRAFGYYNTIASVAGPYAQL